MRLDEIPTLTTPPPDAERVKRRSALPTTPWRRRTVLKAAATTGTGIGLAALGVFSAAKPALADGYDIYGACPSYAADHNCSPGCGPSLACYDCCSFYNVTDCTAPAWFKNSPSSTYKLRPNQCYAGTYDGWNWRYAATCGCCRNSITYRCHDGYKNISGTWQKRICRSVIVCTCYC